LAEDTKRSSSGAAEPAAPLAEDKRVSISPESSHDGDTRTVRFAPEAAAQPAAPLPESQEKRMARNNVAYTKAQFLLWYDPEWAEREWEAAPPVCQKGPRNALTGRVMPSAEKIIQEMYQWYHDRAEEQDLHVAFRYLHLTLFKHVKKGLPEDQWLHPADVGGASQPAAENEAQLIVSKEYVTHQVQKVIAWRETWLKRKGLSLTTVLRGSEADDFLADSKAAFHSSAEQLPLQERDAADPNKRVSQGKHSRWSRHQQKRGGSTQMWTLLSFTGCFDVKFLEEAILKGSKDPPRLPGERTDEEKAKVRDAQVARAELRRAKMLEGLQKKLSKAKEAKGKGKRKAVLELNAEQQRILQEYRSGALLIKANDLTRKSGHGRLKRMDDSYVDIGGSTGGFLRIVLDDWEPRDLAEFEG
jgi:hypothetical protein